MKKTILSLLAFALLFGSCDQIENPISVVKNRYLEELYGPAPLFPSANEATRNVLFEEFTGHLCGACPASTSLVLDFDTLLGERLVTVAIHAGTLAETGGTFQTDYTTPAGNLYWSQLNEGYNPSARINRLGGLSNYMYIDPSNLAIWQDPITTEMNSSTPVVLQAQCEYLSNNNVFNIHMNSQFLEGYAGNVNLVVLLVESHLISPQAVTPGGPYIYDYEHEHVLRTNVSEPMGNQIASNPAAGFNATTSFTIPLKIIWTPTNMTVIGYLVDADTHEVLNAIEYEIN